MLHTGIQAELEKKKKEPLTLTRGMERLEGELSTKEGAERVLE